MSDTDPFGDGGEHAAEDLSNFQPPADGAAINGEFYEVETSDATGGAGGYDFGGEPAAAAHEEQPVSDYSYEPQPVSDYSYEPQPVEPVAVPAFDASTSGGIPAIEEENELTKFMREYEEKIANKAVEQEKVAVECKAKAEHDMEQFVAERARIKEAKQQANRVHEQATLEKLALDLQTENPFERVVTLVDLEQNRKQKLAALNTKKDSKNKDAEAAKPPPAKKPAEDEEDVSRMRQLFVQLKAEPLDKTRGDTIAAH